MILYVIVPYNCENFSIYVNLFFATCTCIYCIYMYIYIASRMWCLARLLPVMIGEFVPENDERWKLFLTLLTIVDYVFAPRTNEHIASYMAVLIKDHHEEFKRLYPNRLITPKLHNMIHIPKWMERYMYTVCSYVCILNICIIHNYINLLIHNIDVDLWCDIGVCDMRRNTIILKI